MSGFAVASMCLWGAVVIAPVYEVYTGVYRFCLFSNNVCAQTFCFVKDFSGTTEPGIWKFGTNVGYDLLYCVRENQIPPAYHSLYLSIFFHSHNLQILYTHWHDWEWPSMLWRKKTKMLRLIFAFFFFLFPSLTYIGKSVSTISQELLHLGFWNMIQMLGMTCCTCTV